MVQKGVKIESPSGKLGVLIPGLGAVSTTFIAGVEAIKKKIAQPVGSLTQLGTIRLGKRTERRVPKIHGNLSVQAECIDRSTGRCIDD